MRIIRAIRASKQTLLSGVLSLVLVLGMLPLTRQSVNAVDVSAQQAFINQIGPAATQIAKEHGLFASIMIAQAILESSWGRSGLSAPPNYNLFGIKGPSDGSMDTVVFRTKEDDGAGNYYEIKAHFRKYKSYQESLQDYAKLFRSSDFLLRHYANFLNAKTIEEAAQALTGTYATDTSYASKLMNIIVGYNLINYDIAGSGKGWQITPKNDIIYVVYKQVNLRATHSTEQPPIGSATYGTWFKRLGTTTAWTLIQLPDGRQGYIASQYTSTVCPPDVTPAPEGALGTNPTPAPVHPQPAETTAPGHNENLAPQPAPTEPENKDIEATHTSAEIQAAKAAADAAIADGTTTGAKQGILDTRTIVPKSEVKVNKYPLEQLLGSNVDLPFASDEVKQTYKQTLQKAVRLYYSPKTTQKQVNEIVAELKRLRGKAETENITGFQADQEMSREQMDEATKVKLLFNKIALGESVQLSTHMTRNPLLDEPAQTQLKERGQRWIEYQVRAVNADGTPIIPKDKVQIVFPIPSDFEASATEVYLVDDQRQALQRIQADVDPITAKVTVQTEELGRFILVEENQRLREAMHANAVSASEMTNGRSGPAPMLPVPFAAEAILLIAITLLARFAYIALRKRRHMATVLVEVPPHLLDKPEGTV